MAQRVQLTATVSENQLGQRLDQALAEMFPDYSRSRIKEWILDQRVLVNGKVCDKPKEKVLGGEQVAINAEIEEEARFEPQDIPLDIVYEDEDIIVINKPRDLVVHPGAGNPDGTVLNALLHYYPPIADVPRAGIVHRLDKDTTGLMVVVYNHMYRNENPLNDTVPCYFFRQNEDGSFSNGTAAAPNVFA